MKPWPHIDGLRAVRWRLPARLGALMAGLLGADQACAAALPGNLTTSVGLLAALAAWLVVKAWSTPGLAESMAGLVAVAAVGAATASLWRGRAGTAAGARNAGGIGLARRSSGFTAAPLAVLAPARSDRPSAVAIALPPGLALAPLLHELRSVFVRLQAAWDAGDVSALQALVTTRMLDEICEPHEAWPGANACGNRTDVVTLHAELLGFEELGDSQLVTVEFSGLIRECDEQGAAPFRELWMLARPTLGGPGWKLARQQALL